MAKHTPVFWHKIADVGMPSEAERVININGNTCDRKFLIRGEYSITTAYAFSDGSGFDTDDHYSDTPQAWAIIKGF